MKVVICGAGGVGFNIARYLAADVNDITVVDQHPDLVKRIADTLDVKGVVGHAAHPEVLERAGAGDAEMLIAVTHTDEVNMVACQVAHSLFDVPTKIARVRHQSYLDPQWSNLFSRDHLPIDVVISPEIEVARAIVRRLKVPGVSEVIPLAGGKVSLLGVRCTEDTPVVNTPLRQLTQLFPNLNLVVVGILRQDRAIVPTGDDQILPQDEVFFVVATDRMQRALSAFGHEEKAARRVLVFGAGNVGLFLGDLMEKQFSDVSVKMIELDRAKAEKAARLLTRTTVLHGDVLDREILEEAGVATAETVVAVTNDDETNILASLLAKRYGSQRAITLINSMAYNTLVGSLGIDAVVNPRTITVSSVLHHVRRGRIRSVHSLQEGFGELIEGIAVETSDLVGKPLSQVRLPGGILLGAVVRDDQVISPRGDTQVQVGDRVVLFAAAEAVKRVEKLFTVRLEYF